MIHILYDRGSQTMSHYILFYVLYRSMLPFVLFQFYVKEYPLYSVVVIHDNIEAQKTELSAYTNLSMQIDKQHRLYGYIVHKFFFLFFFYKFV